MGEEKVIIKTDTEGNTYEIDEKGSVTIKNKDGKLIGFQVVVASGQGNAAMKDYLMKELNKEIIIVNEENKKEEYKSAISQIKEFPKKHKHKKHKYAPKKFYDNHNDNER